MKLSEAIILGDTLKKCNAAEWLSPDGSCGCALGGALLAVGVNSQRFRDQLKNGSYISVLETEAIRTNWPWLTIDHISQISWLYSGVETNFNTIEDVAAYVRSIEPPEDFPVDQGDETDERVEVSA